MKKGKPSTKAGTGSGELRAALEEADSRRSRSSADFSPAETRFHAEGLIEGFSLDGLAEFLDCEPVVGQLVVGMQAQFAGRNPEIVEDVVRRWYAGCS